MRKRIESRVENWLDASKTTVLSRLINAFDDIYKEKKAYRIVNINSMVCFIRSQYHVHVFSWAYDEDKNELLATIVKLYGPRPDPEICGTIKWGEDPYGQPTNDFYKYKRPERYPLPSDLTKKDIENLEYVYENVQLLRESLKPKLGAAIVELNNYRRQRLERCKIWDEAYKEAEAQIGRRIRGESK